MNPCSRTAPCKTFAGAISKTATNGEISVLDPGGFGAVTITKSITIDGTNGAGFGSILAAGTNGILINITNTADTNSTVILRNLSINGFSTGLNGIRILAARSVIIEETEAFGFRGSSTSRGISDERQAPGNLAVSNSSFTNNSQVGIAIVSPNRSRITAVLDNVLVHGNGTGLSLAFNAGVTVTDSAITANTTDLGFGIVVQHNGTEVQLARTVIAGNGTVGLRLQTESPTVRISETMIVDNAGAGVSVGGGTFRSWGNNRIAGNADDSTPGGSIIPQQ
ncbi:MAG: right-handed parallel beta-helix repeat-containing protein [Chloroflexota bacterium]